MEASRAASALRHADIRRKTLRVFPRIKGFALYQ